VRGGLHQHEPMFRTRTVLRGAGAGGGEPGIARAAIEELPHLRRHKAVTGAQAWATAARRQPGTHEAQLQSARAWFYAAIDDAWTSLTKGDRSHRTDQRTAPVRRACGTHGAEVARAYRCCRAWPASTTAPDRRCVRDANAVTQHAFLGDIVYQNAGPCFSAAIPCPATCEPGPR